MAREAIDIYVERIKHSGALLLSTIHNGTRYKRLYLDRNQREAKKDFRQYVRSEEKQYV